MTTAYTNDLRLSEMATGENAGTWGSTTNTNLELIAEAFGYGTENLGSDANTTITMADGSTDAVRSIYLKITSTSLSATRTVTLAPNTVSKIWVIENATTGGQSITIKQGSGATITIPNGANKVVVTDGAGSGAAVYDALADIDLSSSVLTTTDINGGTIDGTTIGGSSAAAGTFTTFTSTGIDDNATSTAITIDSSENVGIGTTSPGALLDLESTGPNIHMNDSNGVLGGSITSRVVMQASGSTHGVVGFGTTGGTMAVTNNQGSLFLQADTNNSHSDSSINFSVDNSERARIDSSGRVLVATTNVPSNKDTVTPSLIVNGSGVAGSAQIVRHSAPGSGGSILELSSTRGSDVNSYTIVQSGDGLGSIAFGGADGNEFVTAAQITGAVDGTPGDNDMPGRIVFSTTADGASSPTERMRILSSGGLTFNGDTATANALNDYEEGDWTPTIGTGATASSDAAYNSSFTAGKYTKVGRIVHCSATLRLTDKGTQSGNISILGLPFTSANNVGSRATWSCWFHGSTDMDLTGNTTGTIMLYQAGNTTYISVRVKDPSNTGAENVQFADISDTMYLQISGSYIAA